MVTSASPLDAQAEPTTLLAALDNNRINRRFHTRNQLPATLSCPCDASLQPYFPIPPFLQHILRPYLPVLVTFHFCNTFLQPSPYPDSQASCATTDLPVRQASTLATTDMTYRPHQVAIGPRHTAADASTATPPPPPLLSAAAQPAVAIPIAA